MADQDIIAAMDKLVRTMPRNPDVLELARLIRDRYQNGIVPQRTKSNITRAEYMKQYMRAYRNKTRANPFA